MPRRRPFIMKMATVGWAFALAATVSGWAFAAQWVEVRVSNLNLRSGPGESHPVIKRLAKGSRLIVEGQRPDWIQVNHDGTRGFVRDDDRFILRAAEVVESAPGPTDTQPEHINDSAAKAETIDMELKATRSEISDITAQEQKNLDEFNSLEQSLNRTRTQVRKVQAAMAAIEDKIDTIQGQSAELEKQIRDQEAYAAHRLVASYKLGVLGRVQFLATADSFFDFIRRKSALEQILGQDHQILEGLQNDQMKLDALLEQLRASQSEQQSLSLTLRQEEARLETQRSQRRAILDRLKEEKALELAALHNLELAASRLNQQLENTAGGLTAAPSTPPTPTPGAPFETFKGLLNWPVQGKIVSAFGRQKNNKFDVAIFKSGIDIQAERGEPVRAVAEGHTIFSDWFNGFGNMIIIDHGRHYYTVYAHLEETFKVKGDRVEKGEVIATLGDSGSLLGPALHFEVRHHGEPTDPMQWIKNG